MEDAKVFDIQRKLELYKSVVNYAQSAVNTTFLLNGGALIGVLTFLGNVNRDSAAVAVVPLKNAAYYFVMGLVLAGLGSVCAYMTQFTYYKEEIGQSRPFLLSGTILRLLLVSLIVASVASFGWGAYSAVLNVGELPPRS